MNLKCVVLSFLTLITGEPRAATVTANVAKDGLGKILIHEGL